MAVAEARKASSVCMYNVLSQHADGKDDALDGWMSCRGKEVQSTSIVDLQDTGVLTTDGTARTSGGCMTLHVSSVVSPRTAPSGAREAIAAIPAARGPDATCCWTEGTGDAGIGRRMASFLVRGDIV